MTQRIDTKTSAKPNGQRCLLGAMMMVAILIACVTTASAARPGDPAADIDYEGSGFSGPDALAMAAATPGGVVTAGGLPPTLAGGGVRQVGFLSGGPGLINGPGWLHQGSGCSSCGGGGCDSCGAGGCDGMGGCNGGCGMSGGCLGGSCGLGGGCHSCGGDCGPLGCGGLLGRIRSLGCGGGSGGVSTCQALQYHLGSINPIAGLAMLRPYTEAGLCAQRWYDFSAEALFLGRTTGDFGVGGVITRRGPAGLDGTPVLTQDSLGAGDLEAGVRLSGALIFGAGGNLEMTYMGGHEWDAGQRVRETPGQADLYSYITNFGTTPPGGFDDTDRSITQAATATAEFHSGELNYRRRTMGPYCRFQGSWLFGLRYLRYDNALGLNIVGVTDDGVSAGPEDDTLRRFSGRDSVKNEMLGAQIGGDFWWNMYPGISLGVEGKLAWLKNDADSVVRMSANSIDAGGPGSFITTRSEDDGTLATEFQTKLVYRLTHSWSFRSAYYLIAIDEVATANLSGPFVVSAVQPGATTDDPGFDFDSVVLQGFSFGAEYIW